MLVTMELQKQSKSRSKILKFLPKAASAVYFHGASYSPKHKPHGGRGVGFSGPLIPNEARRKPRNNVGGSSFGSVDEVEPTSPKVSCMGQIKQKKEQHQQIKKTKREGLPPRNQSKDSKETKPSREVKKHASAFRRMFSGVNSRRKSDADVDDPKTKAAGLPDRAPSLSQMRRFASGRGQAFANFDWQAPLAKVAPRHDDDNNRNYHSDEDGEYSDHEDQEREHKKFAFSAPLTIGGWSGGDVALQPRKEINLWKRRTMAPPSPLQVKAH